MERVYLNVITGALRKFIKDEGYFFMNGKMWVRNGTSEELIKSLPYYKLQKV